jgi:four helix bundle protein
MKTFQFLDFKVYQDSKIFHLKIVKFVNNKLRQTGRHYLADQIIRSSLSVVLNIAEGSAKKSDKDFAKFLEISLVSLNEVVASLDVAHNYKLLLFVEFEKFILEAKEIAKQLSGFIKKLRI